jgi:hypothetical protein
MSTFYSLPREVRLQIYHHAFEVDVLEQETRTGRLFSTTHKPDLSLLLCSKQIYKESQRVYYKSILLSFSSLDELVEQMKATPDYVLGLVKHIRICRANYEPFAREEVHEPRILRNALLKLPNLESFVWNMDLMQFAERMDEKDSKLCCDKAESMAKTVAMCCPELKSFGVMSPAINLDFLLKFRQLRCLHISGYSRTPPQSFLHMLSQMSALNTISLHDSRAAQFLFHKQSFGVPTYMSLPAESIVQLSQLSNLSLLAEDVAGFWSSIITPDMIEAASASSSTLDSFTLRFRHIKQQDRVLEKVLLLLDQHKELEYVDIKFGISPAVCLSPSQDSWLTELMEDCQLDDQKYNVSLEKIPSQASPRAIGIDIHTWTRLRDKEALETGYTKPQPRSDNKSRWICHLINA